MGTGGLGHGDVDAYTDIGAFDAVYNLGKVEDVLCAI